MKNGFYWIEIEDSTVGPEIARLSQGIFFTTRTDRSGEVISIFNDSEWLKVLAGPLEWLECRQPPLQTGEEVQP